MTLLAPFFLLGTLAIALPILIHLRRRAAVEPQPFPSLMFLSHVPVRTIKRRRLRDIGLLLARCAALILAAFLFARPTVSSTDAAPGAEVGEYVVVAVDRSFSMSPDAVAARLSDELQRRVENPVDQVAVIAFDVRTTVVEDFRAGEAGRAASLLDRLQAGSGATRFDAVARTARRLLLDVPEGRDRRFVLLSDLQRRGWAERQRLGLGAGVEVEVVDLSSTAGGEPLGRPNVALLSIDLERQEESGRERVVTRATVQIGEGIEGAVQAALLVDEREVARVDVTRREDQATSAVEFPPFTVDLEGAHRGEIRLEANGDVIAADDRWRFALAPQDSIQVLVVRGGSRRSAAADLYLRRALESVVAPRMRVSTVRASALEVSQLERAQVVFAVDSLDALSSESRSSLERFVRRGGGLFVALGPESGSSSAPGSSALLTAPLAPEERGRRDVQRILLAEPQHPALSPLSAGPASSGLGAAAVYRAVALLEPTRTTPTGVAGNEEASDRTEDAAVVLARLDDGRPLLIEQAAGEGRIHWFGTTLDRSWSDLVLQPGFVPWIDHTVRHLGRYQPLRTDYRLADVLPMRLDAAEDWTVVSPRGERTAVAPDSEGTVTSSEGAASGAVPMAARELALTLSEPGFWSVESEQLGEVISVAVNVDPLESDLRQLDVEEFFAAWLGGAEEVADGATEPAEAVGERENDRLAWWLGALLLAVVTGEGALAIRRSRTTGQLAASAAG